MMLVAHIDQISRNRQYISLENGDVLLLSRKDILFYQIREGEEISEEVFRDAREQMRRECLVRSGSLLQSRDYSRKRLGDKLREYGYPPQLVEETLDSLQEAHYLDDERLAQTYVLYHMGDRSRRRIRMDLEKQGISPDLIDAVFEKVQAEMPEESEDAEAQQMRLILRKRCFDAETANWKELQKIKASLYRKGYSAELIERVLRECREAGGQ